MNGENLYELYERACNEFEVGVDKWDDLPILDQTIWNNFAQHVNNEKVD